MMSNLRFLSRHFIDKLPGFRYRRANHSDYQAVLKLPTSELDYLPDLYHSYIDHSRRRIYVCEKDGEIVGLHMLFVVDDGQMVVSQAARVKPELQCRGITSSLIQYGIEDIRATFPLKTIAWTSEDAKEIRRILTWNTRLKKYNRDVTIFNITHVALKTIFRSDAFQGACDKYKVYSLGVLTPKEAYNVMASIQNHAELLPARDETRGRAAVEQLKKDHGVEPKFFPLDITNKATIENLRKHLQETYGGLDVLVNNAAIIYQDEDTTPFSEKATVTVDCNFTGTLDVSEALFPLLRSGARVVHLSSRASTMSLENMSQDMRVKFNSMTTIHDLKKEIARFVEAAQKDAHQAAGYSNSAYGMSKIGVTVMTQLQQVAIDADASRTDILVNSCCPGYVDTDMTCHKGPLTIDQGADTPIWLATLPAGATSPKANFCAERKIIDWRTETGL